MLLSRRGRLMSVGPTHISSHQYSSCSRFNQEFSIRFRGKLDSGTGKLCNSPPVTWIVTDVRVTSVRCFAHPIRVCYYTVHRPGIAC